MLEQELGQVIEQPITETLETNYMPYAISVIVSRAIPGIDGFKPSHRKLLYTMYTMGLLNGARTKSANVVGTTMKLNPHGDAAIYETMVRLTRGNESLLYPLVDSKGNFGKKYSRDMAFAAARYTEVKLEPIASELFNQIDKNTVDLVDNYDGTLKEPTLLPVTFPNILINPNQGIAVGMTSNICSYNLTEICEATIALLKNEKADIYEFVKGPDFPTGGQLIFDEKEHRSVMETGIGTYKLRGKYRYDKKQSCIDITEIPYTTTIEAIIDKISLLAKTGKLREINEARDESDISGLKLSLEIKRGTDPEKLMSKLLKMTELQTTFSCNFNVLIEGSPYVLGIRDILNQFIKFRVDCIRRASIFEVNQKERRLHLLRGLEKILLDIDKAIAIIRNTALESDVIPNLMRGFDIDQEQAEYIAEIKLRNLNQEYIIRRTADIEKLIDEIAALKKLIESDREIKKQIAAEQKALIKKYGKPRKTEIIYEDYTTEYDETVFVEDYPLKLFFTKDNYFKKIPLTSLRSAGEQKLKDGDMILQEWECNNVDEVLFFTDKQTVYKARIADLPDCKVSSLGEYLPNLLKMQPDELVKFIVPTKDYHGHLLFAFENGKVSKVPLNAYATKSNRKQLINAYGGASPLVDIIYLEEDKDILLTSNNEKLLLVHSSLIPEKSTKSTIGVQVMTLKKNLLITEMKVPQAEQFTDLEYYRGRTIPVSGRFLTDEDRGLHQLGFFSVDEE